MNFVAKVARKIFPPRRVNFQERRALLKRGAAFAGTVALISCGQHPGMDKDAQIDSSVTDARIDAGTFRCENSPVDLPQLARDLLALEDFSTNAPYEQSIRLKALTLEKPYISLVAAEPLGEHEAGRRFNICTESVDVRTAGPGGWYYETFPKGSQTYNDVLPGMISDIESDLSHIPSEFTARVQMILDYLRSQQ